ncbi:hypothetical protein HOLleu_31757 [Holothuria leucospilota]|uniref:Uncharacterized protein n=1 Tax=Holothuria leucospilota TaxID=206669 RepID=A0A9Q0YQW2_HOLLE|nr:hypothetical protein HOLleu_31757 [Holothuria leucospilota]
MHTRQVSTLSNRHSKIPFVWDKINYPVQKLMIPKQRAIFVSFFPSNFSTHQSMLHNRLIGCN